MTFRPCANSFLQLQVHHREDNTAKCNIFSSGIERQPNHTCLYPNIEYLLVFACAGCEQFFPSLQELAAHFETHLCPSAAGKRRSVGECSDSGKECVANVIKKYLVVLHGIFVFQSLTRVL